MQIAEELMQADIVEKPAVTAAQRRLVEWRYDLTPRLDPRERCPGGSRVWLPLYASGASPLRLDGASRAQEPAPPDTMHLGKPVRPTSLCAAIDRVLRQRGR